MNLERRQSWPALAIMCVGILTLAITLRAVQQDMPVNPPWILGVLAALYAVLALLAEGFTLRSLTLLGAMLVSHLFMALLMGWGYSAVENEPRAFVPAAQHGLWDYLPGTALQFGFACLVGIVLDAWLEPQLEESVDEADEGDAAEPDAELPDLAAAADVPAALALAVTVPGVAGALVSAGEPQAAGIWARDPQAAHQRLDAITSHAGAGLNSIPLDAVSLISRAENGHLAALLVTRAQDPAGAHALLRGLWTVLERETAAAPAPNDEIVSDG